MNRELPDVQARFSKGRGTRDQIASIHWIMEKAREFQRNIYFCFANKIISNHDGMIIHLEPDILECEGKWALESITINKASGGDGILVELFQILKDDAVKVLHSTCQQVWKSWQWPQDWKRSVFIPIPKKGNAKESLNSRTIALISHGSKIMLKFFWVFIYKLMFFVSRGSQFG